MKLYKHKTSRDTAFKIAKKFQNGKAIVRFYNINSLKMDPSQSYSQAYCGRGYIRLQPMEEYEVIDVQ